MSESYIRTPELLALIAKVMRRLVWVTAIAGGAGVIIGTVFFGLPGLWAALIAAAIGIVFTATTVAGLHLAAGRGQELLMMVLLGGWLLKMIVLGGVFFWLRDQTFYHMGIFVGTVLAVVIGALIMEMVTVATARIPYVGVSSVTGSSAGVAPGAPVTPPQAQEPAESSRPPAPDEGPGESESGPQTS